MQPAASDLVDHRVHPFFQASTVEALFTGKLEGDLTFAELARHGDLGIGTLNALDGEMIAVDGRFMRADADGAIGDVPEDARTPFAVVTFFEPVEVFGIEEVLDHDAFLERLDRRVPPPSAALRIDGEFDWVRARSVPRQRPPYRSLAEIASEQHVFELSGVRGTMVGFRFPDHTQGLEVPGYHLTSSMPHASGAVTSWPAARAASRCAPTRPRISTWSSRRASRSAARSPTRIRFAASSAATSR